MLLQFSRIRTKFYRTYVIAPRAISSFAYNLKYGPGNYWNKKVHKQLYPVSEARKEVANFIEKKNTHYNTASKIFLSVSVFCLTQHQHKSQNHFKKVCPLGHQSCFCQPIFSIFIQNQSFFYWILLIFLALFGN